VLRKLALFLLFTPLAFAQFTTVTGTVIDPNGVPYALGTITPLLIVPSGGGSPTLNGLPYSPPTSGVGLDKTGSFSFNVASNTSLLPVGTTWNFSVCSAVGTVQPAIGTGSQCFTIVTPITITGGTQSITIQLHAAAPALTIPIGGGGSGPALPAGVAAGSALVSNGVGALIPPVYQLKPSYDTRDYSFICNGTAYNTSAAQTLVNSIAGNQANVQITQANCGIGDFIWPSNINLDFSVGGSFNTLTDSTTVPGNGAPDNSGSGQCQSNNTSPTCAITVTPSAANESYFIGCMSGFSSGLPTLTSSIAGDIVLPLTSTNTSQHSITRSWLIPNVATGSHTFTLTFGGNLVGACSALAISGLGPTPYLDGAGNNGAGNGTPMSSGAATFLAGSFLIGFGGNNSNAETCTAGAGFVQPPGAIGNSTNTASAYCMETQNSASAGSTTATQNISSTPTANNWAYQIIGLRPSSAHMFALGGITNPNNHQIFLNATGNAGVVDFTGNLAPIDIMPEWWGAAASATQTQNCGALQASEHGAYGTNRVNGSGLNIYNKNWLLTQPYQINCELQLYHVIGAPGARAQMICKNGGNITQNATNQRILDMQSVAYWDLHGCSLSTQSSQDASHPLIDDDYTGLQGVDLAPQFTTFYDMTLGGGGVAAIGLLGAKSGGGAQYSNIYAIDNLYSGFTQACYQIGTPTNLATNALALGYSGDMQACPQYGVALYGAGFFSYSAGSNGMSSMENGFATQTGFDFFASQNQGPLVVEHFRSESRKFAAANTLFAKDVLYPNQATSPIPGSSDPVGTYKKGSYVAGDGAWYKVTVDGGPYSGVGTTSAPLSASSGSTTTIADTNDVVPGALTIKQFALGDALTQAVTGSTANVVALPSNFSIITGTLTSGTFVNGETVTQAVTGVTATDFGSATATQLFVVNLSSGGADNTHTWTGNTSGATFAPSSVPVAQPANPALVISAPTGSPDGTHNWTNGAGATYVPSGAPTPQVNFTVNAFTGQFVSVLFGGTNALCYGTVTSNTSNTITLTGGWITQYQFNPCTAPDNTSSFIVEPPWSHTGSVVSGGMTLQYSNENTIQGDGLFDSGVSIGALENVNIPGGQVHISGSSGSNVTMRKVTVSRSDWYVAAGGNYPQTGYPNRDWDVQAILPGSPNGLPISWAYPFLGGASYNGALHRDLGAERLCWNAGTIGLNIPPANTSAIEICAGGRSDQSAGGSDLFRNRFEVTGTIGQPAPNGTTNGNGADTAIAGGGSTGSGLPGAIRFKIGATGSAGVQVNSGADAWVMSGGATPGNFLAAIDSTYNIGAPGANRPLGGYFGALVNSPTYQTTTNCSVNSVSPAACGSAASGAVVIPTTTTSYTINTTAVTAHSRIQLTWLTFASDLPSSPTCVAPSATAEPTISAVVAGTSFTITLASTTGQTCPQFQIIN
jgi:hypothetical protein